MPNFAHPRLLVWHSLGWLGSLSFLGSSVVVAQAPIEQPTPTTAASSQPVLKVVPPQFTMPEVVEPSATPDSTSSNPSPTIPQIAVPELAPVAGNRQPLESNGAYIDSTNYNTGATDYLAPNAVVVTERSTGCRTTLNQSSALVNNLCSQAQASSAAPSFPGLGNRRNGATPQSAINFGPVSINPSGLSSNPTIPDQRYYNPYATPNALRLPPRLGNNNTRLMFPLWVPAPITSLFGWRVHPITGESRHHSGVDLGAPLGTPVLAAYAGRVVISDFMGGYGLTVAIGHNNNLPSKQAQQQLAYSEETLYAHLSETYVKPGDWVEQGAVIGLVGSTGLSTGPHLHFELRQATNEGWVTVDPGVELEQALAFLIQSLQYADAAPEGIASGLGIWLDTSMSARSTSTFDSIALAKRLAKE